MPGQIVCLRYGPFI
jgi:glutaminyl-tRNA synthetase